MLFKSSKTKTIIRTLLGFTLIILFFFLQVVSTHEIESNVF